MPKVIAYECPHTKQLFRDEKLYKAHLRQLSRHRANARKTEEVLTRIKDVLKGFRKLKNAQEICEYIVKHNCELQINGLLNGSFNPDEIVDYLKKGATFTVPDIEQVLLKLNYSDIVSNTHSAPRNGETNWSGDKEGVPRGYPGFHGRIEMAIKNEKIKIQIPGKKVIHRSSPSLSDMFGDTNPGTAHGTTITGLNTGSGGGRGPHWAYDISLFVSDFTEMSKIVTFAKLTLGDKIVAGSWMAMNSSKEVYAIVNGKVTAKA